MSNTFVDSSALLHEQRGLRSRLLDHHQAIAWRPARDLAAELLLYLDEPEQCWRRGACWLRERLDADRVDAGYTAPSHAVYRPQAEALREGREVPSVVGAAIATKDAAVAALWATRGAIVFADVAQDRRFGQQLRAQMCAQGTQAKLAMALSDGEQPVGLLCADWMDQRGRWSADVGEQLESVGRDVLGPVLAAAQRLCERGERAGTVAASEPAKASLLAELTPAELRIARMIVTGMSYKEVARRIDRSFSTVDHQLRSIRDKLRVSSTAQLVHLLSANLVH